MNQVYNRYIPQSDGTYRRRRIQEQHNEKAPPTRDTAPHQARHDEQPCNTPSVPKILPKSAPRGQNVEGFLKQILPKDFDTGDLLVILLLLLMSGDNKENQNNALLTLALYLFM